VFAFLPQALCLPLGFLRLLLKTTFVRNSMKMVLLALDHLPLSELCNHIEKILSLELMVDSLSANLFALINAPGAAVLLALIFWLFNMSNKCTFLETAVWIDRCRMNF
jgi:hypothetical protein